MSVRGATISTRRKFLDKVFGSVCISAIVIAAVLLIILLGSVAVDGVHRINGAFFENFSSRRPASAGIRAALFGTACVIAFTAVIAIPIGVAAAIYLEEYVSRKTKFTEFIQLNISNLAGVPSIIYGLLGLALFVRWMSLDRSVLSGALTMSLLILPMVILVTQEALRAVPRSIREGSYALGATRWQTIRGQVLPAALPGIMTGVILAISRAIGETAPLITIGAVTYIAFTPTGPLSKFTVLPIQIFDWSSRPQPGFHDNAAAAILILLCVLLALNSFAIILRYRTQKRTAK